VPYSSGSNADKEKMVMNNAYIRVKIPLNHPILYKTNMPSRKFIS
jgi:hypothetical protein